MDVTAAGGNNQTFISECDVIYGDILLERKYFSAYHNDIKERKQNYVIY